MPPVMIALTTYSVRLEDVARSARGRYAARYCRAGCGRTRVGHAVVHEQLQHVEVLQLVH